MGVSIEPVAKATGKALPKLIKNPVFLVGVAGAVILGVIAYRRNSAAGVTEADTIGSYSQPADTAGADTSYSDIMQSMREDQTQFKTSVIELLSDYQTKNTDALNALQETAMNPVYLTEPTHYTAADANYGYSSGGDSGPRLSAAEQIRRTSEIIADMKSQNMDTKVQDTWLAHVIATGENYDKTPVKSYSSGSSSRSSGVSVSISPMKTVTLKQGEDHAPKGLSAGTVVKTGGGNYQITGVKSDGSYTSKKVS